MKTIFRAMTLGVCLLTVQVTAATAQHVPPVRIDVPDVPSDLVVPDGHQAYLRAFAAGTQNYICLATAAGTAWKFLGPQATLYQIFKGEPRQQLTTHFLSADVSATPVARPTWQHSFDSSRVWGRVIASSTDAAYVKAGAIPWLLLAAATTQAGHDGGVALAETTFIQRVNTVGGVAPASGCSDPSQVGALALVPYSTDYVFYRLGRTK